MTVALLVVVAAVSFDFLTDNDGDDHAVDAEDTGHDYWDEGFHDYSWSPDCDTADAGAGFCGSVGCAEVYMESFLMIFTCEDQGHGDSHEAEEGGAVGEVAVCELLFTHFDCLWSFLRFRLM